SRHYYGASQGKSPTRTTRGGERAADARLESGSRHGLETGLPLSAAPEVGMEMIKVLLFAASPRGTAPLDLPREFREIDEEVRMSPHRAAVELILVPGARPVDLLRKINENRPHVVHLSGHGEPGKIILESGQAEEDSQCAALLRSADERDMKSPRPEPVSS